MKHGEQPNLQLLADLRALRNAGAPWIDVVRLAADREPLPWRMTAHLEEAFGFDADDLRCLGGWSPDGTGELSDGEIDVRLQRAAGRRTGP